MFSWKKTWEVFLGSRHHSHNSLKDRLNRYEVAGIKLGSCHAEAWEHNTAPYRILGNIHPKGSGVVWF